MWSFSKIINYTSYNRQNFCTALHIIFQKYSLKHSTDICDTICISIQNKHLLGENKQLLLGMSINSRNCKCFDFGSVLMFGLIATFDLVFFSASAY